MLGSTVKQNSLLLLDTLDRNDRKSILGYDLPGLKTNLWDTLKLKKKSPP